MWNNLPQDEKEVYNGPARVSQEHYNEQMEAWLSLQGHKMSGDSQNIDNQTKENA